MALDVLDWALSNTSSAILAAISLLLEAWNSQPKGVYQYIPRDVLNSSAKIGFVGPRNLKINLLKGKFASFEPIRTTFDENPGPEAVKINIEFGEKSTI